MYAPAIDPVTTHALLRSAGDGQDVYDPGIGTAAVWVRVRLNVVPN